jgi:predicted  nucleic acid-binding Zn-ribbon protein
MKSIMQHLIKLQSIEFSEVKNPQDETVVTELRKRVPAQILGHYDRLVARGKKGVAAVRHQTCSACHMNIPLGAVLTLRRDDDIVLCESCGRYLYLEAETEIAAPAPVKKRAPRAKAAQPVAA